MAFYFPSVDHVKLAQWLLGLGCDMGATSRLLVMLDRWGKEGLKGLPIGPELASALGNAYLMPVDQAIKGAGFKHFRHMDDIVVVGRQLEEGKLTEVVDRALADLLLSRSEPKTRSAPA